MIHGVGDFTCEVLESEPARRQDHETVDVRGTRGVEHVGHDVVEVAKAADGAELVRLELDLELEFVFGACHELRSSERDGASTAKLEPEPTG
jgi:hypothetical protein